jgi:hypothetical protein
MNTKIPNKPSLWDNPMVKEAQKSLSPEDLKHYKEIGESMYKDVDFETSTINGEAVPPFISNSINYIINAIKSGLHISMLDKDEVNLLENIYGKQWYINFGFVKEDLDDIVTIKKD